MTAVMSAGALVSARVRAAMVARVRELGVHDERVLAAIDAVPRHAFVDPALASRAYEDTALPIGHGQTISQPYVVARMAALALETLPDPQAATVLEVGSGCGYACAVFARLFGRVVSVERLQALHRLARERLRPLRLANVHLVLADGSAGYADAAPYDAIIAAAAAPQIQEAWFAQLAPHGRIVAPLGDATQSLVVAQRDERGRVKRIDVEPVRFVPLRNGIG